MYLSAQLTKYTSFADVVCLPNTFQANATQPFLTYSFCIHQNYFPIFFYIFICTKFHINSRETFLLCLERIFYLDFHEISNQFKLDLFDLFHHVMIKINFYVFSYVYFMGIFNFILIQSESFSVF